MSPLPAWTACTVTWWVASLTWAVNRGGAMVADVAPARAPVIDTVWDWPPPGVDVFSLTANVCRAAARCNVDPGVAQGPRLHVVALGLQCVDGRYDVAALGDDQHAARSCAATAGIRDAPLRSPIDPLLDSCEHAWPASAALVPYIFSSWDFPT